jgi:cell division protein FtsL
LILPSKLFPFTPFDLTSVSRVFLFLFVASAVVMASDFLKSEVTILKNIIKDLSKMIQEIEEEEEEYNSDDEL